MKEKDIYIALKINSVTFWRWKNDGLIPKMRCLKTKIDFDGFIKKYDIDEVILKDGFYYNRSYLRNRSKKNNYYFNKAFKKMNLESAFKIGKMDFYIINSFKVEELLRK